MPRLVSVVMTAYNTGPYLDTAITSVLGQTYPHLELIVVDDGSTDGTREALRAFAARDRRVKPIFLDHGGHGAAANAGVRAAGGAFIARIDHDDEMRPERLAVQIEWLDRTGADLCGSHAEVFDAESGVYAFPETHEAIRVELLFRPSVLQPSMLARTEVMRAYPYLEHVYFDDYEWLTRVALACRLGNVPTVLQRYRRHASQTHQVQRVQVTQEFRRYRFRYFFAMFPDASPHDYLPIARVADRIAPATLLDLERAGAWIARFAAIPDPVLLATLARRWAAFCELGMPLGAEAVSAIRDHVASAIAGTTGQPAHA